MNIPDEVLTAAKGFIDMGYEVAYLGKTDDGEDAYYTRFPDDEDAGFPEVYLYDGVHSFVPITGFAALDFISSFLN